MQTVSVVSICLSSYSQLSPYYASFFGSLSLSGEPGHCPEHPWASPAVPCPSSSLLHLPTPLKTKLSPGPGSEPLCAHSPLHPHSFTPLSEHIGRLQAPWKGRKSLATTQTTGDSVASVQDRPRQRGSPLSTGTEPGGAGSFPSLTPGSR